MKKTTQLKNWTKDLSRHFTKDNMKIQIYKDSQHLRTLWNHKLKRDTTTHLLQ